MKRFILNPNEERILDHVLSEYRAARIARTRAQHAFDSAKYLTGWKREFERTLAIENLAVNREAIRILTDITTLLRTQR